jgi:ABC-type multidrug transport system fused ATPase/permease subunit
LLPLSSTSFLPSRFTFQHLTLISSICSKALQQLLIINKRRSWVQGLGTGILSSILWATVAGSLYFVSILLQQNGINLTLGSVFTALGGMLFGMMGIAHILALVPEFVKLKTALKQIFEILSIEPEINHKGGRKVLLFLHPFPQLSLLTDLKSCHQQTTGLTGNIELSDVVFRHPINEDIVLLNRVNAVIRPGQITGTKEELLHLCSSSSLPSPLYLNFGTSLVFLQHLWERVLVDQP